MKTPLLFFAVSFCVQQLVTAEKGNTTAKTTSIDKKPSTDIFRQLLNQETIIRLSLTKKVHTLMKDMLTMKQTLLSTGEDLTDVQKEIVDLRKENIRLKNELSNHNKTFIDVNNNFQNVKETFEKVHKNTSEITNSQKIFEAKVEENAKQFQNKTASFIEDLRTEMNYTSVLMPVIKKHVQDVQQNLPIWMNKRLKVISDSIDETIGNLSMGALKLHISEEVNNAVNEVKVNFLGTQKQQVILAKSVSSLEMFRMNVSDTVRDIGHPVGFTAVITSTNSGWTGYDLIFPDVISNIGGGYNPSNGIFTSPVDGNFVFYIAIVSYSSNSIQVEITVNDRAKVRAQPMNGNYESGSNLLIVRLQKGEKVAVKRSSGSGYYSESIPMMTFSGFKI